MYHFVLNMACGVMIFTIKSQIEKIHFFSLHYYLLIDCSIN